VAVTYDSLGRLHTVQQGARTSTLEYDERRYLASITDPLNRTVTFSRDDLGRVIAENLPGGRTVGFSYDPDGNLTSITPPSRPSHALLPNRVDLLDTYTPPAVSGTGATHYAYNKDRQLTLVTRPDASTIG